MRWIKEIADELVKLRPDGEILIESGGSPSGTHHIGHLRELIISDALLMELKKRGRQARHIYYVDDLDAYRKVPVNVPAEYEKYLGVPLCDIPAPSGEGSYADYFLKDLKTASKILGIDVEFVLTHPKYRAGFFVPAIEKALENVEAIRKILETVSGHKLSDSWSPIQIMEDGWLKNRKFLSINKSAKTIDYQDRDGVSRSISYSKGEVKLDWRIDWPARWWLQDVAIEAFGRDHATKGGSYDTGAELSSKVFKAKAPQAVPYDFVNLVGDTKKMSASKGTGLDAISAVKILPPEIVRFFMLRYAPSKRLYFDPENGVSQLIDEFAELMDKDPEASVLYFSRGPIEPIVSRVPFSHLVASYQAALKDADTTLDILSRTGYQKVVESSKELLKAELHYIDRWLEKWAPEDLKFELSDLPPQNGFDENQKKFLNSLADKIANAPENADGEWFHKAIYDLQAEIGLPPRQMFTTLYRALIGKDSGPRAGWFLSILPRDWLLQRLRFEA